MYIWYTKKINPFPQVESDFDLVLILERLDESLVLLADKLCWSLQDVATLKINQRYKELL